MNMNELYKYDVPWDVVQLWRARESDRLLPLQEQAVKHHDLFGDGNLLIQAPTSAGKTFIGEMAAIRAALRRKQVIYLVPLKALAEEKYEHFRSTYEDYGLKVIISTRDHRQFDQDLEDGRFSIAVVVYEKLEQLLVRRPERLGEIELVIADEIELLSDMERGADVEILLTQLLRGGCRVIGLSAVLGHVDALADWMQGEVVTSSRRPSELRYGVLHDGVFRYRTYDGLEEGEELLAGADLDSPDDILAENVSAMAKRGEACLVFVKARYEARAAAEALAERVDLPAATNAIEALQALEPTRARDLLLSTLNQGVAFHSADLAPAERRIVERAFRDGEVCVLTSTSTLAKGVNMPAQNVFVAPDKWNYDARLGAPWQAPVPRSEYENMGGRAGRFGASMPFGRSILLAPTQFDSETLWRRYVDGEREPVEPRLATAPLEDAVLRLVAARTCRTEKELHDFFEETLTGRWIWAERLTADEVAMRIMTAVNRGEERGMILKDENGLLRATPFGQAVAAKGISMATAYDLERWIHESERRAWESTDLILAAALTEDGRVQAVSLSEREYEHADYVGQLAAATSPCPATRPEVPLHRFRDCTHQPFFEDVRAIKAALLLSDWIREDSLNEIEERYHVMAGQILVATDQISWIIDAGAALAQALGCEDDFIERMAGLAERVQHGVREELLPLVRQREITLSRHTTLAMASAGIDSIEAIAAVGPSGLTPWLSRADASALNAWAARCVPIDLAASAAADQSPTRPVLIIDEARPGEIQLDGALLSLQEKQYQLISILAQSPGECIPYGHIYECIWGDAIVEDNQMAYQKSLLMKEIRKVCPARDGIIKTIPKRGYMLNLPPETIWVQKSAVNSAA